MNTEATDSGACTARTEAVTLCHISHLLAGSRWPHEDNALLNCPKKQVLDHVAIASKRATYAQRHARALVCVTGGQAANAVKAAVHGCTIVRTEVSHAVENGT